LDDKGNMWVVIHSGSRNFGKRIADYYQKKAREACDEFFVNYATDMEFLPRKNIFAEDYIEAMVMAQHFAHVNRWVMMNNITRYIAREYPDDFSILENVESVHNYIDFQDKIIRKGAIRAHNNDICIIPFNSAEGSAICEGKGNPEWNYSAPHGAGRLMSRTQARNTLDYKEYQKRLLDNGVYSSTANTATLDEAPMAYKSSDSILKAIEPTVNIITLLKPFYNFKDAEKGRY